MPERLHHGQKKYPCINFPKVNPNISANQSEERERQKVDMMIMIWASTVILITNLAIDSTFSINRLIYKVS